MTPVLAMPRGVRLALGVLMFQGAWFTCVLGAASGAAGIGSAAVAGAVVLMGACSLPDPSLALAAIALGWSVITPLHLAVARRLAGARP